MIFLDTLVGDSLPVCRYLCSDCRVLCSLHRLLICQLKRWIQQQAAVALVPIYRIDFALHPFTRSINVILFVFWCLNSELQFTDD